MEAPVVRDALEKGLDELRQQLVDLGDRTDAMLDVALDALRDGDTSAAAQVVAADQAVDRLDQQIQQRVVEAIALHGPVGRDLRQLTATLRASLHLERAGDYAVNVARATERSVSYAGDSGLSAQLHEMGTLAREVCRLAVRSFVQGDVALARHVPVADDGVDQLNVGIFQRLVKLAAADDRRLEWATQMILVARLIERYGDHGVDLAEQTVFVVTGEPVELSSNDPE